MLIKANKSKKNEAKKNVLAKKTAKNLTLPDQILSFISNEVEKNLDQGIINEQDIEGILSQKLSQLDLVKSKIPKEDLEKQAQAFLEHRKQELLAELNQELDEKRQEQEKVLEELREDAQAKVKSIIEDANLEIDEQKKLLEQEQQAFEQEKIKQQNELEQLKYDALKNAINEVQPYVNEVVEMFRNLNKEKHEIAKLVKDNLACIAFDVAKQILKYEVHVNDNLLEQQVLHSINKLLDSKGVMKLILNSADKEKQAVLEELIANILDKSIRLVYMYDDEVDPGSCVIETQGGKLNSSFSVQLDKIKATFEQFLGHKISILPDEPLLLELSPNLELEEIEEEVNDENHELDLGNVTEIGEESHMPKNKTKPQDINLEPSDEELIELEDNFEDFADLDIEDDLDALFGEIESPLPEAQEEKSTKNKKTQEEFDPVDLTDSDELGANDFANGDDWAQEDDFLEDLSETKDDEYQDEEGNTFVEYNEFQDDENFGDSGELPDERFPEY